MIYKLFDIKASLLSNNSFYNKLLRNAKSNQNNIFTVKTLQYRNQKQVFQYLLKVKTHLEVSTRNHKSLLLNEKPVFNEDLKI